MFNCHLQMRPFLADLRDRAKLPLTYTRALPRYQDNASFRHEIEVFGPPAGTPTPYFLPHAGTLHELQVVAALPYDGTAIMLSHDDATYTVASVLGRRVLLSFDLEHLFEEPGGLAPGLVLEAVLAPAVLLAAENVRAYSWSAETTVFVNFNVVGIDQQILTWRNQVRDNEYELDRLCAMSAGTARKNSDLRDNIRAASQMTRQDRESKAQSEFEGLTKMVPEVIRTLSVDHGRLTVVLQPLTLDVDECCYNMGSYTLHVDSDRVRIHSDNGRDYPHPHVSSDGIPCWGNLGSVIAKALGEREFVGLVTAIVAFLQSYNARDAYRDIEQWDPDYSADDND